MSAPRVSICLPTFNGARDLRRLLPMLAAQRLDSRGSAPPGQDLEIVAVDSSSSDDSLDLLRRAGARVEVIPQSEFRHGGTRNRIASLARGEILLFLSQGRAARGGAVHRQPDLGLRRSAHRGSLVAGAAPRRGRPPDPAHRALAAGGRSRGAFLRPGRRGRAVVRGGRPPGRNAGLQRRGQRHSGRCVPELALPRRALRRGCGPGPRAPSPRAGACGSSRGRSCSTPTATRPGRPSGATAPTRASAARSWDRRSGRPSGPWPAGVSYEVREDLRFLARAGSPGRLGAFLRSPWLRAAQVLGQYAGAHGA
jgi:hypothetical protein